MKIEQCLRRLVGRPRPAIACVLIALTAAILGACATGADDNREGRMPKNGDTVVVHYTGTLDDGTEFDSSRGKDPLTFTVGQGQVIAGFDQAVIGLEVGESTKVHIEAEDAYGERRADLVINVPAAQAPPGLQVGQRVALGNNPAVVTAITPEAVTVDANHELAGKPLNFEIELVSIQ